MFSIPTLFQPISLINLCSLTWFAELKQTLSNNFGVLGLNYIEFFNSSNVSNGNVNLSFSTNDNNNSHNNVLNIFSETSSAQRFTRFNNVLISYDYKTGNYIGNWDKQYPFLINSFIEVARGIRKPSWFFSEQYNELLKKNYDKFFY